MLNKKYIINIVGTLLMLESLIMIIPAIISILYGDTDWVYIGLSAAITLMAGSLAWYFTRDCPQDFSQKEGYIVTSIIWVVYGIFGALPFFISGWIPNFIDAVFETISGFTVTGATILHNVESLPHGLLFWRSMTHLIGGIGILVLFIVVLPMFGTGNMMLYKAETSSVSMGKLHPRTKETAKRLLVIYLLFVFAEAILLIIGKMPVFDAFCHAFGTVSSGGFSTRNGSMAAFSPFCQYVVMFFMLIAGINFNLHYFLLKGTFKKVFKDNELKLFLIVIGVAGILITSALYFKRHFSLEESFRTGFFQVISIISCTGFRTTNFMQWMPFMWFILFILMFIGGCAGSTSGSIKVVRYHLFFKNLSAQFKKILHERGIINIRLNDNIVSEELISRTLAFFFIYLLTWGVSTFLLLVSGLDFLSSAGVVASCMGGVGPGLGSTLTSCADVSIFGKVILSLDMLLGRLEIFSMLIIFTPYFWKSR